MKNNNISPSVKDFEAMTILSNACAEVSIMTVPTFLENMENALKKRKAGGLVKDDIPEFLYLACEGMSVMLLDSLEKSNMFKQFENPDYKIQLYEKTITRMMAHLAGMKEKRSLV